MPENLILGLHKMHINAYNVAILNKECTCKIFELFPLINDKNEKVQGGK